MNSILIITSFLPYPIRAGGDQAQFNMIEALRNSYKIGIVFPVNRDNMSEDVRALSSVWPDVKLFPYPLICQYTFLPFFFQKARKYLYRKLLSSQKSQIKDALYHKDFLTSGKYLRFIEKAIEEVKPDIIQVEFIQNLNIGAFLPGNIRKLFVHHEIGFVITDRMLQNISLTQKQQKWKDKNKQTEIFRLNQFDGVVTLTETDKNILLESGVKSPIYVSPAAVNTKMQEYGGWNGNIFYVGGYLHCPNHEGIDWFLSEVTPCIDWRLYPHVKLVIIGSGWPLSYEREFNGLRVHVVGYVDDLSKHLSHGIMIVPLLTGSGMRMKILDAAALSVPFVSTSVGAEGLKFCNGDSCLIGDGASGFAQALTRLISDENLRATLAKNAHRLYKENYSLEKLVEKRKKIYQKL